MKITVVLWLSIVILSVLAIQIAGAQPFNAARSILYSTSFAQVALGLLFYKFISDKVSDGLGSPITLGRAPSNSSLEPAGAKSSLAAWRGPLAAFGSVALVLAGVSYLSEVSLVLTQQSAAALVWGVAYYIVLIGLAEEILFRGIPFVLFAQNRFTALLISSTAFALYHVHAGAAMLPYFFAFGILFAVLRLHGVSIVVLALAHGAFNIAINLVWQIDQFRFGATTFHVLAPQMVLLSAVLAGWFLSEDAARSDHEKSPPESKTKASSASAESAVPDNGAAENLIPAGGPGES